MKIVQQAASRPTLEPGHVRYVLGVTLPMSSVLSKSRFNASFLSLSLSLLTRGGEPIASYSDSMLGLQPCAAGTYQSAEGMSFCNNCSDCGAEKYLLGCQGDSAGTCQACRTCPTDQYLLGCTGQFNGTCTGCSICPQGSRSSGCGASSDSSCEVSRVETVSILAGAAKSSVFL